MALFYQRPRKVSIEELTLNYGRFSAEPFERGYATTIGNALRRVILSLMEGAAITALRIEGALHEFSTIPGIYEDVINIILNLKAIPLKLKNGDQSIIRIFKEGPGEVLSQDIDAGADVEVLDKRMHIAYLDKGASFNAEIIVKKGYGYKLVDQNYDSELPVDFIPIDSNFSPIDKVNFKVLPSRVGKTTDYEKLIVEIWTNGSISPREALSNASKILRDHLAVFLDSRDEDIALIGKDEYEGENIPDFENMAEILRRPIESLGLSIRALKCLKNLNVNYIFELIMKEEDELLKSKNFGKKSLEEIVQKLSEHKLTLNQKIPQKIVKQLQEQLNIDSEIVKTDDEEDNSEE